MKERLIKHHLTVVLFSLFTMVHAQQFDIELNETNKAGVKIQNLNTSSASSTYMDFYNNADDLFQIGITGSNNNFFSLPRAAYLFTLGGQNIPIAFATNGKERMRIDSEGRLGIGQDNSLSSLVSIYNNDAHKDKDALFIVQDSAANAIEIFSAVGPKTSLIIGSVIGSSLGKVG